MLLYLCSFSQQLAWLVQSYAIRWRAIFYGYEQTVFQLDFHLGKSAPVLGVHDRNTSLTRMVCVRRDRASLWGAGPSRRETPAAATPPPSPPL
jgi:hypothetical protein